jgi:hypothetical protein
MPTVQSFNSNSEIYANFWMISVLDSQVVLNICFKENKSAFLEDDDWKEEVLSQSHKSRNESIIYCTDVAC